MSEHIGHECGIALVRMLKPLAYYAEKYQSPLWGFEKLFLLMEKQHNRGQDGAGVACVKLDMPAGEPYMFRERNITPNPLDKVFGALLEQYRELTAKGQVHPEFPDTVKRNFDFGGELLLGHLRYGTSGGYGVSACHPYFRRSSWPTRNLALCGNFNMTNTRELNASLIAIGQHPIFASDTQAVLEKIGFFLDEEHEDIYRYLRTREMGGAELSRRIGEDLDVARVLTRASQMWDGGYATAGLIGAVVAERASLSGAEGGCQCEAEHDPDLAGLQRVQAAAFHVLRQIGDPLLGVRHDAADVSAAYRIAARQQALR